MTTKQQEAFDAFIEQSYEATQQQEYWTITKDLLQPSMDQIKSWPDEKKVHFIIHCIQQIDQYIHRTAGKKHEGKPASLYRIRAIYIEQLFKTKLVLRAEDVKNLQVAFCDHKIRGWDDPSEWPIHPFLKLVDQQFKVNPLPALISTSLTELRNKLLPYTKNEHKAIEKIIHKIDGLLFADQNDPDAVRPILFLESDQLAPQANAIIAALPKEERQLWYPIIGVAMKVSGGKPKQQFLDNSAILLEKLGFAAFKKTVLPIFQLFYQLKEEVTRETLGYGAYTYQSISTQFLSHQNAIILKGLVWICSQAHDDELLRTLAMVAERAYRKVPGRGPAAAAIGNACFFTLNQSDGLTGIGQLSRLKVRIKQSNAKTLINNYLNKSAKAKGITIAEIEDMAIEDFDLKEGGVLATPFEDVQARISISAVGKTLLEWIKPDGKIQKSVPAFVKKEHAEALKQLKATKKQIEKMTSAQRDRIDLMFRSQREWDWTAFEQQYLKHGLMSYLVQKLIWSFQRGEEMISAMYIDQQWTQVDGQPFTPSPDAKVSLWHPAIYNMDTIQSWRDFLIDQQIQQPLKQAFREVYLLTEAEINTNTYSNRMAAHILKQHQFNMLAKTRGWKYALMGAYDDGRYNEAASLALPELQLCAEFWINELHDEDATNETGIHLYIATDQVRFIDQRDRTVKELVDIPPIPFSEVMRDVDLFVGVASVGNDPTWNDSGGLPAHRDYWQSYSFGDLTEIAKNRKTLLSNLVPRLKIKAVAEIKGNFLKVRGKMRTYKIHIGSTNILMEPNDQYLCIVPDRSQKNLTGKLFIPFEGDKGLSIVLSKAFLLAKDDEIQDPTIISQIQRY
ncbi:MAG: DUF4132 domain-containing protein [Bacteroidota bacterium]